MTSYLALSICKNLSLNIETKIIYSYIGEFIKQNKLKFKNIILFIIQLQFFADL